MQVTLKLFKTFNLKIEISFVRIVVVEEMSSTKFSLELTSNVIPEAGKAEQRLGDEYN